MQLYILRRPCNSTYLLSIVLCLCYTDSVAVAVAVALALTVAMARHAGGAHHPSLSLRAGGLLYILRLCCTYSVYAAPTPVFYTYSAYAGGAHRRGQPRGTAARSRARRYSPSIARV